MSYETQYDPAPREGMVVRSRDRAAHGVRRLVEPVADRLWWMGWSGMCAYPRSTRATSARHVRAATFDEYWNDPGFERYDPAGGDSERLDTALAAGARVAQRTFRWRSPPSRLGHGAIRPRGCSTS